MYYSTVEQSSLQDTNGVSHSIYSDVYSVNRSNVYDNCSLMESALVALKVLDCILTPFLVNMY